MIYLTHITLYITPIWWRERFPKTISISDKICFDNMNPRLANTEYNIYRFIEHRMSVQLRSKASKSGLNGQIWSNMVEIWSNMVKYGGIGNRDNDCI